jgi:two-component system, sensor histidine kinase
LNDITPTKILIVDDHIENIVALRELISFDNVEIHSAMNADQALELINKHNFGLLLLDVQMPVTSGFELAQIIRGVKRFRSIPIIFVTASQADQNIIFESYQSGAVDLLFKPLDPNVVRAKISIFIEISQQKNLLLKHVEELRRLRLEAEAANIAKSQFLANMSHEIRTPLAAVLGFSELLQRKLPHSPENDEFKDAIERNGALLMRIVDDVLNLSKFEAGHLKLENTDFNIDGFIKDIESTLSYRAKEKGLTLNFKNIENWQGNYIGDPLRLKQIFLNVIGNAIKFTKDGQVNVEFEKICTDDSPILFSALVSDEGIGLSKQQIEGIFKPFAQADASTQRLFGGSGLGLVISKKIANAMGGNVEIVESELGVGSTFKISFNMIPSQIKNQILKSSSSQLNTKNKDSYNLTDDFLKDKTLLAVDDSPDNLTLLSFYLKKSGAKIITCSNGLDSIDVVKKNPVDIILMDIQMPLMDGHRATQAIRENGFKGPILAFTAHAIQSERMRCLKSGCDDIITKPINQKELLKAVNQLINRQELNI